MSYLAGRGRYARETYPEPNPSALLANLIAVLANDVQQQSPSGTTVAAGTAITLDANLALIGLGSDFRRVKVTATASFTSGAGVVTPFLQVGFNGGPFSTEITWAQVSDGEGDIATSFILNLATTVTSVQVHWQTTAGDAGATLGHGIMGFGATLLIEELPR